jgi:hypothetical protein
MYGHLKVVVAVRQEIRIKDSVNEIKLIKKRNITNVKLLKDS